MNHKSEVATKKVCEMGVTLAKFDGCHLVSSCQKYLSHFMDDEQEILFEKSKWKVKYWFSQVKDNADIVEAYVTFKLIEGSMLGGNMSINFLFNDWSIDNYVLIPAAVYNGNRFKVSEQTYPPMLTKKDEIGVNIPTTVTDVPRLSNSEVESKIQFRTGDMSTPTAGFFDPKQKKGFFILTTQKTLLGDSGISIEENSDRSQAVISLSAPAVRHDYKYSMCNTKEKSDDKGYDFHEHDEVTLKFRLYSFDCNSITDFFEYFSKIRKDLSGVASLYNSIPFSEAWKIQEQKYNRDNWVEQYGFYRISTSDCLYGEWQTGWVGGGMNSYPLLLAGDEISKERAYKTLDFVFSKVQAPSGFLYGIYYQGKPYSDSFKSHENTNLLLLRKNADAIYFIVKQFMLIKKMEYIKEIPNKWEKGLEKVCDAFIRLWKKYGQFGQFVDIEKEEIIIGGSASVGIAPAALALAGQYYDNTEYIAVAKKAALYYYENYVKKGITNGAPGEICQCPDSESAFGLLESYVVLYEVTGDRKWIAMAKDTANYCSSWCMSYDFDFPQSTAFAQLNMHTTGAVWANVQNKHAAPGICTLSGDSLFKLYRATGNKLYLELIQEIAHNITQYLSRTDRPLTISWRFNNNEYNGDMNSNMGNANSIPSGWMNERVNTSDWEGKENIGGIAGGSCWCEVSNMLTYVEVPGVYIQKDTGYVCAIDHVDINVIENDSDKLVIKIKNPTKYLAKVKLFIETSEEMLEPIGQNTMLNCKEVTIESLSNVTLSISK